MSYELTKLHLLDQGELINAIESLKQIGKHLDAIKLNLVEVSSRKQGIEVNRASLTSLIGLVEQLFGFDVFLSTVLKSCDSKPGLEFLVKNLSPETPIVIPFHVRDYLNIYSKDIEDEFCKDGLAAAGRKINWDDKGVEANVEFDFESDSIFKVMQDPHKSGPRSYEIYELYTKMLLVNTLNDDKEFKEKGINISIKHAPLIGEEIELTDKHFKYVEQVFKDHYFQCKKIVDKDKTEPKVKGAIVWRALWEQLISLKSQILTLKSDHSKTLSVYQKSDLERFLHDTREFMEDSGFLIPGQDPTSFKFPTVRQMQSKKKGASIAKQMNDGIKKSDSSEELVKGIAQFKARFIEFLISEKNKADSIEITEKEEKKSTQGLDKLEQIS